MVYVEDVNLLADVVDPVSDAIFATACPPESFEGFPQRGAYPVRPPE